MPTNNIEEILSKLDTIIEESKVTSSRLGFFPAIYRQVTANVNQGIDEDFFDDGPRMEKFTIQFANRYLFALDSYVEDQQSSKSWEIAFDFSSRTDLLIVQHILLGMNTHINFDLAVVTAEISTPDSLPSLEADFNRINDILAESMNTIQEKIGQLSPLFDVLDKLGGVNDESIINFSINKARKAAWERANLLVGLPENQRKSTISLLDKEVSFLGRLIAEPGGIIGKAIDVISWAEEDNVVKTIDVLK